MTDVPEFVPVSGKEAERRGSPFTAESQNTLDARTWRRAFAWSLGWAATVLTGHLFLFALLERAGLLTPKPMATWDWFGTLGFLITAVICITLAAAGAYRWRQGLSGFHIGVRWAGGILLATPMGVFNIAAFFLFLYVLGVLSMGAAWAFLISGGVVGFLLCALFLRELLRRDGIQAVRRWTLIFGLALTLTFVLFWGAFYGVPAIEDPSDFPNFGPDMFTIGLTLLIAGVMEPVLRGSHPDSTWKPMLKDHARFYGGALAWGVGMMYLIFASMILIQWFVGVPGA